MHAPRRRPGLPALLLSPLPPRHRRLLPGRPALRRHLCTQRRCPLSCRLTYPCALVHPTRPPQLWHAYLTERLAAVRGLSPAHPSVEAMNNVFERAMVSMHKMPRIWMLYLEFMAGQAWVTRMRRLLDRCLMSLPVTQHERIWPLYLRFIGQPGIPVETAVRVGWCWQAGDVDAMGRDWVGGRWEAGGQGGGSGGGVKCSRCRGQGLRGCETRPPSVATGCGRQAKSRPSSVLLLLLHGPSSRSQLCSNHPMLLLLPPPGPSSSLQPTTGVSCMLQVYRRYLKLEPTHAEEYIAYLRIHEHWEEAARRLAVVVNDEAFRSLEGKSKHQLWLELCDMVTKHPNEVKGMKVDAILRSGIRRFTDEVRGLRMWCWWWAEDMVLLAG